ncbi:MAG: thioredoxin family protein [Desulfopila sp.]|jgi:peroxiredoxin|nr:thioredoxin family protein [Desulfopila sp.]
MSLTPSTMLDLGTPAPNFTLSSAGGNQYCLADQKIDKGLLVIFMCNHCPYVIHIRSRLVEKIRHYQQLGVEVVAINSNDYQTYPDDSPEKMAEVEEELQFSFPYLVDETQKTAKAYRAACTPDFFLFNAEQKLVYRGQFDSARPGNNEPVSGEDLSKAIEETVAGKPVTVAQRPSMGCNIKWKEGNAPGYFS